ncbi:MAG TPA: magnesium transporter CorA family protein [Sphingomicrobium sp.]
MLRVYGPGCDGRLVDPKEAKIPEEATWVDLEEPTHEEEALVERCIHMDVPTESEMAEIEPSSRLYEQGGALYMTVSVLYGVEDGQPSTTPISFVLTDNRLVTVRYATPKPVRAFVDHARRDPDQVRDAQTALVGLLDALIDRLADELEDVSRDMEDLSRHIFHKEANERRIPAARLTALLTRIGRTQTLLTRTRLSSLSTLRLLSFLSGANKFPEGTETQMRHHIGSMIADATALSDHATFLSDNVTFLLDASLGLISIEQNAAMKLFSWAALVFLPPTLIAGVYGMNFRHMPELQWIGGYPMALVLMLASAVLPVLYLRRRGWI